MAVTFTASCVLKVRWVIISSDINLNNPWKKHTKSQLEIP